MAERDFDKPRTDRYAELCRKHGWAPLAVLEKLELVEQRGLALVLAAVEHALDAALEECNRQGCPVQVTKEAKTVGVMAAKVALGIPASDAYSGVRP